MTATVPLGIERRRPGFADDLARHADAVALITPEASLTYAELDERVAELTRRLGTTRRLVLLNADNTVDAVVAYLAALRGRHPVMLVGANDAVARDALVAAYDPDVVVEGTNLEVRRDGTAHNLHPDLALLLSTSGSTGTPKLVRLSHQNVHANATAIAEMLAITPADRAITTLPMQYCYGLSVLNSYLAVGAGVVLTNLSVVDACFWRLARQQGVTSFAGVPHTFELLDRIGFRGDEVPSLRYLTQAGGHMPPERVARYARLGAARGFDLVVMYGQTEATARMAYLPPALAESHPGAIGVAVPGGALRVEAPGRDGVGELVYRGPNVMMGYATTPADLGAGAAVAELRTGDLARQHTNGLFEVVGRQGRFIKPFGVRVDLDDLERVLADAGVAATCTGDDSRLVVALARGQSVARATDVVATRLRLPLSHVAVVEFDEVPRLLTGKPDYAAIRAHAEREAARRAGVVGCGTASVREAFRAVLGVTPEATDTFVGLGGDSLSYVEVSILLEDHLGELPRDWHAMSVGALETRPRPRRAKRTAKLDTTLVVRAVAIVLVVGTHAGAWRLQGGAHALIALAGFNFARFQLTGRSILPSVARLAVPSMAWIAVLALFSTKYGWSHVLLVNDVFGPSDSVWSFWFVEAIVQISLVLAVALAVPAVSRFERQRPFAVALGALAVGLGARFDLVPPPASHVVTWPHELFWIFALGWAAARARRSADRLLVTAVALAALPGFFPNPTRGLIVLSAVAAITWLPTVAVPRAALRVVTPIAGASLYVYLTHLPLYSALARGFGPIVALAGSLVVGVAAWRATQHVERVVRPLLARLQRPFARVVRTRNATGITLTSSNTSAGSAAAS